MQGDIIGFKFQYLGVLKVFNLLFFLVAQLFSLDGQNTNNHWYFGDKAGVYFDSLGLHTMKGNVQAAEGTSSISDGCGLLFYTDGDTVWNKNGEMMENGFDIGGKCTDFKRSSTTQSSLIIRKPGNDSIFYIFTTDCVEDLLAEGFRYSIVNMNKNGGLGEVEVKRQLLFNQAEEKVTAAKHKNGCDVWVISHQFASNKFYSYLLSRNGLNDTPVISYAGQVHNCPDPNYPFGRGYLKASPNGKMLINVNPDGVYYFCDTTLPELFNFDQSNGTVTSNFIFPVDTSLWWLPQSSWSVPYYGASFSPNNSKLYLSGGFYGPHFYQYDLNAGSVANILASRTFLGSTSFTQTPYIAEHIPTSLVNAPDGKMYVAQKYKSYLGLVQYPDSLGNACNYLDSAIQLTNGSTCDWGGLPNFFEDYINPKSLKAKFTYFQKEDTIFFVNHSIDAINYSWYFGDTKTSNIKSPFHVYIDSGYYDISLFAKDSFCNVERICHTIQVLPVNLKDNIIISSENYCVGDSIVFQAKDISNFHNISWDFGDGTSIINGSKVKHLYSSTGNYKVSMFSIENTTGIIDTAYLSISINKQPKASFSINDSIQCENGNSFTFSNFYDANNGLIKSRIWDFDQLGISTDSIVIRSFSQTGIFSVKLILKSEYNCSDTTIQYFEILPNPKIQIEVNSDTQCLEGNDFDIRCNQLMQTYKWDLGDGVLSSSQQLTHSYTKKGVYEIVLKVLNSNTCEATDSLSLLVVEPFNIVSVNKDSQCLNNNTFQFSSSLGKQKYDWNLGDGQTRNLQSFSYQYSQKGNYKVVLETEDSFTCLSKDTLNVYVKESPFADFLYIPGICNNKHQFINQSTSAKHFYWLIDSFSIRSKDVSINFNLPGQYEVKLFVYGDDSICNDTVEKLIDVIEMKSEIVIPNVFTPGKDGINDCYTIGGLDSMCYQIVEISIFNRWGLDVFSGDLRNDCWNGRLNNTGEKLPNGVYYYILKIKQSDTDDKTEEISGVIHLIN